MSSAFTASRAAGSAQLLREGQLVIGHGLLLRQLAEASADTERQILETEGAVTEYDRGPLF